ncbi:telomere binding protein, variant 2 [Basidiobolus ranarum]|uniref:Telomere binding protein, variant 2 n=1 Tax=Basidiobolus ranarum TaxID=34480 RepID=A0ABR2VXN9_9FUNG
MGNLLSGNIPELFRSDIFITKLLEQSDEAIAWYAKQDLTVNQATWIGQCIGELYQKTGRLGYGKLFGASLYTYLRRNLQSSYSNNYRAIYEKVLINMNELEIDKFMDSLLRSSVRQEIGLEPPHERTSLEATNISITRVAKFFHSFLRRFLFEQNLREDEMLCSMNIKFLFTEKYLINRTFESEILRAQICILSGYPDITPSAAKPLLNSTFKKLLKTWADPIFIQHGSMEQHLYITKAILISLGYYDPSEIEKLNVLSIFMPGVTRYLESTNTSIRKYGMVTAELFAKRIGTNEAQTKPLDFGLDESDPDIQMLRKLTEFPDGLIPERAEPEELQNTEEDLSSEKSASIEDNSDDEWDPDSADILELTTGSDSDEAEDDDDDLEPYPMDSEDEDEGDGKSKLKKPKYLSECLSYLKADEEPDKIENGLDTAVEIILNATEHELSVYGQEFVRKLLRIQDTYELSGFEKNRTHALVTLIVMCPNVTNNYLIEQFYERDYSMSQRFLILNCLVLAAQELSQVTKTPVEADSSSKHDKTIEYGGEMLDSIIEDIQKIGIGNGKNRWASRRQEVERRRGPPSKNRFAQVAGRWFFFAIIHGVGPSASDIFNILGHPVLLEKFVTALATLLYLSVGTLDFSKMCREFWDFSKSLKYYSHEGVISGVIFGLLVIATVLPGNTLVQEYPRELSETKEWASELYDKIQNEKLKSQCLGLLMKYQQIVSEYQKELFIEAGIVM